MPANLQKYLFIPVIFFAAFLYFHNISAVSLWNDEAFSYLVADDGVRNTLYWIESDTHPPLYYLALTAWLELGHGVTVLRSLSVVSAIGAALGTYFAARIMFGRRTALIALGLFVLSPHALLWAQKARPYAFQTMLVALSFWGFTVLLRAPDAGTRLPGSGFVPAWRARRLAPARTDLAWFAYAIGGGLAMLAQHPAGFYVLGCNAAMALVIVRDLPARRLLLRNWILAQIVLSAIWLLWLPEFLAQYADHLAPGRMAQKHGLFLVTAAEFRGMLVNLFSVAALWRIQFLAFLVYAAMAALGTWHVIRRHADSAPFLLVIGVPIAACALGFALVSPVFGYVVVTFNWILVPYCALIAAAIAALHPRVLQAAVFAGFVLMNLWGLRNQAGIEPPPIAAVAAVIAAQALPGDGIIFSDTAAARYGIAYYLRALPIPLAGLDRSRDGAALIRSAEQAARNSRNWMVLPQGESPAAALPDGAWSTTLDQPIGSLVLRRYERRP